MSWCIFTDILHADWQNETIKPFRAKLWVHQVSLIVLQNASKAFKIFNLVLFKAEDKLHGCQILHTNPSLAKLLVCERNGQSVKQKERVGHRKWQQLAVVKCIVG